MKTYVYNNTKTGTRLVFKSDKAGHGYSVTGPFKTLRGATYCSLHPECGDKTIQQWEQMAKIAETERTLTYARNKTRKS